MAFKKLSSAAIIALTIAGVLLTVTTLAALNISQSLTSTGTVNTLNLAVYSDSECTLPLTSVNWGSVTPGSSNPTTIYIKNTGNITETLTMTTGGWDPLSSNSCLTLTWDKENAVVAPGSSTAAVLTLVVDLDTGSLSNFSFNITLTGTQ